MSEHQWQETRIAIRMCKRTPVKDMRTSTEIRYNQDNWQRHDMGIPQWMPRWLSEWLDRISYNWLRDRRGLVEHHVYDHIVEFETLEFNLQSILDDVNVAYQLACKYQYGKRPETIYVGGNYYPDILRQVTDRMPWHPISVGETEALFGCKLVFVPWLDGILVI